jgi:hypothetical protein
MRTIIFFFLTFTVMTTVTAQTSVTFTHVAPTGGQHWKTTYYPEKVVFDIINYTGGVVTSTPHIEVRGVVEETPYRSFPFMMVTKETTYYFDKTGTPYEVGIDGKIFASDRMF